MTILLVCLGLGLFFTAIATVVLRRRARQDNSMSEGKSSPYITNPAENLVAETDQVKTVEGETGNSVDHEVLLRLEPIKTLSEAELLLISQHHPLRSFPAGAQIFKQGDPAEWAWYVLSGQMEMATQNSDFLVIDATEPKARFPLSGFAKTYPCTGTAGTAVEMLRIPASALSAADSKKKRPAQINLIELTIPPELNASSALYVFCQTFESGQLHLPTLPQVALKLREALQSTDVSVSSIAKIVQTDPVCAAKLVQVANSPLYAAPQRISTCHDAIVRLGLTASHNLIVGLSMGQMFNAKNSKVKQLMHQVWRKSVYVSALASTLAIRLKAEDADQALMAGLLHQIGAIPFLSFVDQLPQNSYEAQEIELATDLLTCPLGKLVLAEWEFPREFSDLPMLAEDWFADTGPQFGLADTLRLAVWHSELGGPQGAQLPPIFALPSFAKLKDAQLSPEFSLGVLHTAREQIKETCQILN